jgi:DNA-binding NarL/FixJ family response regulator
VDPAPETADSPTRLLIVEDHELLSGTLAFALRQLGIEVESSHGPTPDDVVAAANRLAPVLVLLDLELGGGLGSGLDLVRPLTGAGAKVVIMTGVTDRARLAACLEAGAIGIVSKTSGFGDLVEAVRRLAEGHAILSENDRQELLAHLRVKRSADRQRLAPFEALTSREKAVLAGLVAGESAEAIAARSYVSLSTVRTQIRSILLKLRVKSQLTAVALAREAGWPPDD